VERDRAQAALSPRVEGFWERFVEETGVDGPHAVSGFGTNPTALGALILAGRKRATASAYSWYRDDGHTMPGAGDLTVVVDSAGDPLCVIRTTAVEVRRFGHVDEEFAWAEGEGDRSLEYWRRAHIDFFASEGLPVRDETEVVLERFELLWWPAPGAREEASSPRSRRAALLPIAGALGGLLAVRTLMGR
jgi:uncharacterized protein YhfF